MKSKFGGIEDTGDEARERFHMMLSTREETRAETDSLFVNAKPSRARDRAVVKKHFVQAPAAITMAPTLQAEPPKEVPKQEGPDLSASYGSPVKTASVAPRVDEWFEKNSSVFLSEAQRRFPELLKVAGNECGKLPGAVLAKRARTSSSGPIPSQSMLSGGSA